MWLLLCSRDSEGRVRLTVPKCKPGSKYRLPQEFIIPRYFRRRSKDQCGTQHNVFRIDQTISFWDVQLRSDFCIHIWRLMCVVADVKCGKLLADIHTIIANVNQVAVRS
jgi:hypothetical protein